MYTYSSFEDSGTFILLRPILFLLLAVAFLLFLAILIPRIRNSMLNAFAVVSLSVVTVFVALQVGYYHAIIVDEIGLGGDPVSFYLFFTIAAFSLMNPILYLLTRQKRNIVQ